MIFEDMYLPICFYLRGFQCSIYVFKLANILRIDKEYTIPSIIVKLKLTIIILSADTILHYINKLYHSVYLLLIHYNIGL